MIRKNLRKKIERLVLMFCILRKKKFGLRLKTKLKVWKTNYSCNDSKWKRIASSCSKKVSALLSGITSKYYGDFYCLNCLHLFRAKNKFESYNYVCENKDFCNIVMPSEDAKIFELIQYRKSDKAPFIIYADLES